eukprot:1631302-Rhodomonas_salina.2
MLVVPGMSATFRYTRCALHSTPTATRSRSSSRQRASAPPRSCPDTCSARSAARSARSFPDTAPLCFRDKATDRAKTERVCFKPDRTKTASERERERGETDLHVQHAVVGLEPEGNVHVPDRDKLHGAAESHGVHRMQAVRRRHDAVAVHVPHHQLSILAVPNRQQVPRVRRPCQRLHAPVVVVQPPEDAALHTVPHKDRRARVGPVR